MVWESQKFDLKRFVAGNLKLIFKLWNTQRSFSSEKVFEILQLKHGIQKRLKLYQHFSWGWTNFHQNLKIDNFVQPVFGSILKNFVFHIFFNGHSTFCWFYGIEFISFSEVYTFIFLFFIYILWNWYNHEYRIRSQFFNKKLGRHVQQKFCAPTWIYQTVLFFPRFIWEQFPYALELDL